MGNHFFFVNEMKKYAFLIGFLLIGIISMNLYEKYDTFVFHAYETVFSKGIYEGENDDFVISDVVVIQQGNTYEIGYGKIQNINQVEISSINVIIDSYKYPMEYTVDEDGIVHLSTIHPISVGPVKLSINDEIISLDPADYDNYSAHVLDYIISDFYVTDDMAVLGYINCNDESIFEKYPDITIEYDYIQDDRTLAYYAYNGSTSDWINANHTEVIQDIDLRNSTFVVIVSLEGEESETYEFTLEKVGE